MARVSFACACRPDRRTAAARLARRAPPDDFRTVRSMPERTLEERYRLLAASFRESRASVLMRESLGDDFQVALDSVVASLWRDVATQPRDLDRDKIASLLDTLLPGRLAGNEKWKSSVPDVLESFLAFVAEEESLSTAWEWSTAIDEHRAAFDAALAN